MNEKDLLILGGLILNFAGVMFAIINSRVKLEGKIVRLETLVEILMRKADLPHRRSDDAVSN